MLSQHEFEFAIYQCLAYGDETRIAAASGKSVSYYSQQLNPDDPRESIFFRAAADFVNWASVNKAAARKAFNVFCAVVTPSLAERGECLCLEVEHAKGVKEDADVAIAVMLDKPLYEQLSEVNEAITQKERQKAAIIEAINAEKDGNGSSRFSPREFAAASVNGRRR